MNALSGMISESILERQNAIVTEEAVDAVSQASGISDMNKDGKISYADTFYSSG
jgi:hypothetical protein